MRRFTCSLVPGVEPTPSTCGSRIRVENGRCRTCTWTDSPDLRSLEVLSPAAQHALMDTVGLGNVLPQGCANPLPVCLRVAPHPRQLYDDGIIREHLGKALSLTLPKSQSHLSL